jgi:hypothetical protein
MIMEPFLVKEAMMSLAISFEELFGETLRLGCPSWIVDKARTNES